MPFPSTGVNADPRNYSNQAPQYSYYGQPQYPVTYPTQMPQQVPQQTTQPQIPLPQNLGGRIVNSAEEITPNEVPMNGSVSYFPLKDGKRIIGKKWNSDGTIDTVEFELVRPVEKTVNNDNSQIPSIDEKLDEILSILTAPKSTAKQPRNSNVKKDE